jgi:four helix bundle protein
MQLTEQVYLLTKQFSNEELYGITSQLRRAAASVPANIAEGHARGTTKEYLRFLSISIGSLAEVDTFLELAVRLSYCNRSDVDALNSVIGEERRMLRGLQRSLKAKL